MAPLVKNLPIHAGHKRGGLILSREEPLEEEMATHSSILAWEVLWTEKHGGLQSIGLQSQTLLHACHTHKQRTDTGQLELENGCFSSALHALPPGLDVQPVTAEGLLFSLT